MSYSAYLKTAIKAAKAAEEVILKYYLSNLKVSIKSDHSPVTQADIEAEKTIKSIIAAKFPEHGFYGEETGMENSNSEYLWLIDPIDGTKSFVRQYPMFSTQIALMHRGKLVLGVSNAPVFKELAYATKGGGAFLNDSAIAVSNIEQFSAASLSAGNIASLAQSEKWQNYGELLSQVNRTRGYGDFYHYHLLASGKIDILIESDVNILDIAALYVIISEAGGSFSDLNNQAPDLATTSVLACGSRQLHRMVLQQLEA